MKIWLTFPPTSLVETLPATFVLQPWPKIFRSFAISRVTVFRFREPRVFAASFTAGHHPVLPLFASWWLG